jgi:hypothetical protein
MAFGRSDDHDFGIRVSTQRGADLESDGDAELAGAGNTGWSCKNVSIPKAQFNGANRPAT